jgi:transposase
MLTVHDYERIRMAYYVEKKSIRQIGREYGHGYWTVRKALERAEPAGYQRKEAKKAPVLGGYKEQIEGLLSENERLPPKQRYTSKKIYQIIRASGYAGAESTVRWYVCQRRKALRRPQVYLPLRFEPGMDGQVDWGEARVIMGGEEVEVQLFVMRLCYSRKLFVMAFPTQKQESFLLGHVQAFAHMGGVPQRLIYDNLKTAVKQILNGRNREEQSRFAGFRSHYLFESRYCTPGQGHEKGGVESDVGYSRRNFLTPLPEVANYAELNALLLKACCEDDIRVVGRSQQAIGERWQTERAQLRPLPGYAFACYSSREVTLNGYGQVTFETNRYSVPAEKAQKQLTLRAYPFHIELVADHQVIASHERCYGRDQDILDPLHYLALVGQRPGAFEHAQPLCEWRENWPASYETLLRTVRQQQESEGAAIRIFVEILQLHQRFAAPLVQAAIEQALRDKLTTATGVRFCLDRLLDPTPTLAPLDLSAHPGLATIGLQSVSSAHYNQLLGGLQP